MSFNTPSLGRITLGGKKGYTGGMGTSPSDAAASAKILHDEGGVTQDGYYWLAANPGSTLPVRCWCDMTTDGGGWMMVARTCPTAVSEASDAWGWTGPAYGNVDEFGDAYQMGWDQYFNAHGIPFAEIMFANARSYISNQMGPFAYKASGFSVVELVEEEFGINMPVVQTLKSDLSIYPTAAYPNMQKWMGYGTRRGIYFMRDMDGADAGYGITPSGMVTSYLNHPANWNISGPWLVQGTTQGPPDELYVQKLQAGQNAGGTNQVLLFVR